MGDFGTSGRILSNPCLGGGLINLPAEGVKTLLVIFLFLGRCAYDFQKRFKVVVKNISRDFLSLICPGSGCAVG